MRAAVVDACHRLAEEGLFVGTAGNLSVRSDDLIAITPTGAVLGEITAEQVVVIDRHGARVEGSLVPTSEMGLHLAVYDNTDARAVVHTHAPASTAASTVLDELPCIHYQQLLLGGTIQVAPFEPFGTPALTASVIDALAGRSAALMANHGAVTYATTLPEAIERTLLLEWLCTLYRDACAFGEPRVLSTEQQEAVIAEAIARKYGTIQEHP